MSSKTFSSTVLKAGFGDEDDSSDNALQELWPLGEIDPKKARFPCCIVWTPLPVVSWLAPYIGHVGICQEDGAVLDFAGSNLVSVDDFAYGSVARYIQLDRKKCCFPANLAAHVCKRSYNHTEVGTAISWDDAIESGMRHFQHKFYNLFTCNCHSFVSNCLNQLAYDGSVEWNVLNVAVLVWLHGRNQIAMAFLFPFTACFLPGFYIGSVALVLVRACVAINIEQDYPMSCSVQLVGVKGLEPALAPGAVSPSFDLLVRVDNGRIYDQYREGGAVTVSYAGVTLAHGRAPSFSVAPKAAVTFTVKATSEGVGIPEELFRLLSAERRRVVAQLDVRMELGWPTWESSFAWSVDLDA